MSCAVSAPLAGVAPAKRLSIRSNFGWTAAGNAVNAACQWGMISALAKLSSAEVVGQYALALAIATPIFMLAQLNLRSVLATDVIHAHAFRDYRRLRFLSVVLGLAVTCGLALAGHSSGETRVIAAMGLVQAMEWSADIYFGLLQQHERMDRIAISLLVRGPVCLAALALTMVATHDLLLALLAVVLCRLCIYVIYDSRIAVRGMVDESEARPRRASQWSSQWPLFQTALPLGLVMMAISLTTNVPRYFISHDLNNSALGIYAALASLTTAGSMVVNALGQTVTPRLAHLFVAGEFDAFRRMTARLVWLAIALGAGGTLVALTLGHRLLLILFRPEYAQHVGLLALLSAGAGAGFAASFLGYAITAARRFREQVPIQIASILASAATAYFLVPRLGLIGAALAIGVAGLVQALASVPVLGKSLREGAAS